MDFFFLKFNIISSCHCIIIVLQLSHKKILTYYFKGFIMNDIFNTKKNTITDCSFSVPFSSKSVVSSLNNVIEIINIAQREALDIELKKHNYSYRPDFLNSEAGSSWTNGSLFNGFNFSAISVTFSWNKPCVIFINVNEIEKNISLTMHESLENNFILNNIYDCFKSSFNNEPICC